MDNNPQLNEKELHWLIKIQQESWQAEIILSGLIIFTTTSISLSGPPSGFS